MRVCQVQLEQTQVQDPWIQFNFAALFDYFWTQERILCKLCLGKHLIGVCWTWIQYNKQVFCHKNLCHKLVCFECSYLPSEKQFFNACWS